MFEWFIVIGVLMRATMVVIPPLLDRLHEKVVRRVNKKRKK